MELSLGMWGGIIKITLLKPNHPADILYLFRQRLLPHNVLMISVILPQKVSNCIAFYIATLKEAIRLNFFSNVLQWHRIFQGVSFIHAFRH